MAKKKTSENPARDEAVEAGEHLGAEHELLMAEPSATAFSGVSEDEQDMPLRTEIVGPPGYGSPNPTTNAGRLLPLNDHPLNAEYLPEGHSAAIAEDYGANHLGTEVMPGSSSAPVIPEMLDLDTTQDETVEVESYEEMKKDELKAEADARGLEVPSDATKAEIIEALEADDGSDN